MGKKWTYEELCEYIKSFECKLLTTKEEYINTKMKLKIQCKCGEVFEKNLYDFKRRKGHRCKKCNGYGHQWTYDEVKKYIENHGNKLLSKEYHNSKELLIIQCSCGNIFKRKFNNYKNGRHNCPDCTWKEFKYKDVKNIIESKGCKLLSEYDTAFKPLTVKCKCGREFKRRFADMKHKERWYCDICLGKPSYTYVDVKNIIESKGCKLLSDESVYKNNRTKLSIECKCGNHFKRSLNNFKDQNQYYCNKCARTISKGELKIIDVLDSYNIKYEFQHKFDDCKFKNKLPFDFYLPDYNICIEYDGKQHYLIGGFGGDIWDFVDLKIRDTVKTRYCENNNIQLIRIPYWEYDNIEQIIISL